MGSVAQGSLELYVFQFGDCVSLRKRFKFPLRYWNKKCKVLVPKLVEI